MRSRRGSRSRFSAARISETSSSTCAVCPTSSGSALVLAELDALSHQEIADLLGVPREKVKALVFQARESLLASRVARETDCAEIREQLTTQRGGGLRRANLRRHLRMCTGCRDYRREVERQRRQPRS